MNTAVLAAVVAAVGNLLQGWDNATMAGAIIHIKREFRWENKPTMEGLTVALSLIGATVITLCSGGTSDWLGRRPMLIGSSVFYFVSGLLMLWSPNVYLMLFARLLDGFGIGLAVTFVPMYISEMAPPEVRGLLSTLPQFMYTSGLFLSYSFIFCMSLMNSSSWRLMLGVLVAPSLIFFALAIFYLPESPRWLLSKGRTLEAKQVLQRLRGREDVSSEMALLVEGLEVGGQTTLEEYIIGPPNELVDEEEQSAEKEEIKLFSPEGVSSMVALRVPENSLVGTASHHGSIVKQNAFSVDPVVTLIDSVHDKLPDTGSKRSVYFPHLGSMFSESGSQPKNEEWDEVTLVRNDGDYTSGAALSESDDLCSPLISRQTTSMGNMVPPLSHKNSLKMSQGNLLQSANGEPGASVGIGSGWHLAWKWKEEEGPDGIKEGSFKRIYLHEGGVSGSWRDPVDGEFSKAAALVSQPALCTKQLIDQHPVGPAMIHPSAAAAKGPHLNDLLEPGVKHALLVGMGIQIIQQFLGINAVLYYTPQILEQAGVQVLLSDMGISSASASLLISAIMTFLMLPCVAIAMRLMDVSGRSEFHIFPDYSWVFNANLTSVHLVISVLFMTEMMDYILVLCKFQIGPPPSRSLLLSTNPVLTASLIILVIVRVVHVGNIARAAVSTVSVILYSCFFAMGFGPIPNILCAEIFPTRVRGICIAICALTFWICNIIVTYTLPVMLSSIGLAGAFSIYALASIISWTFVYFKVPETKGMPLEVIVEFFAVGAKAKQTDKANN